MGGRNGEGGGGGVTLLSLGQPLGGMAEILVLDGLDMQDVWKGWFRLGTKKQLDLMNWGATHEWGRRWAWQYELWPGWVEQKQQLQEHVEMWNETARQQHLDRRGKKSWRRDG